MLWLAISLPQLPLDTLFRSFSERHAYHSSTTKSSDTPLRATLAVSDKSGNQMVIYRCNKAAHRQGIRVGQALSLALSIQSDLIIRERRQTAEQQTLERLAAWCYQFSDRIVIDPPEQIVLEVRGSCLLFHGIGNLRKLLLDGLKELGFSAHTSIAPTLEAAQIFTASATHVLKHAELAKRLDALSLAATRLEPKVIEQLASMGVNTLGQLRQIPTASINKRFGKRSIDYLQRLYGENSRLPEFFELPEYFEQNLLLPFEIHVAETLLFAIKKIILELEVFLRLRACTTDQLKITLGHREATDTQLIVGLLRPTQQAGILLNLIQQQLANLQLSSPVLALNLRVTSLQRHQPGQQDLLNLHDRGGQALAEVLQKIANRVGDKQLYSLMTQADHRPEQSFKRVPAFAGKQTHAHQHRPLWLLAEPTRLERDSVELISEPERIATGWWDNGGYSRDYYVARNHNRQRLWIYYQRKPEAGWFVHGYFD